MIMGLKKYLSSDNHTAIKINKNISRIFQIKRSCLQRILEIADCSCLHRQRHNWHWTSWGWWWQHVWPVYCRAGSEDRTWARPLRDHGDHLTDTDLSRGETLRPGVYTRLVTQVEWTTLCESIVKQNKRVMLCDRNKCCQFSGDTNESCWKELFL